MMDLCLVDEMEDVLWNVWIVHTVEYGIVKYMWIVEDKV